jgi:hypothetical protein
LKQGYLIHKPKICKKFNENHLLSSHSVVDFDMHICFLDEAKISVQPIDTTRPVCNFGPEYNAKKQHPNILPPPTCLLLYIIFLQKYQSSR